MLAGSATAAICVDEIHIIVSWSNTADAPQAGMSLAEREEVSRGLCTKQSTVCLGNICRAVPTSPFTHKQNLALSPGS